MNKTIIKLSSFVGLLVSAVVLLLSTPVMAQNNANHISGTIYDQDNLPVTGATVFIVNTSTYTTTNFEGQFELDAKVGDRVQVAYMGYSPLVFTVGNKTKYQFNLEPDKFTRLDAAVSIGYGEVRQRDLTGSVATVNMSDIKGATIMSVDNALQGRIAGADIMSTDGEPGAVTSIRIRGTRSITASNEPLIVVDGVMNAINDLNDINADDIESISVLRDASSVAIYGSLGANGVILITTKSHEGASGKTNVKFTATVGFSQIPEYQDIMNASEYAQYRNDLRYFDSDANEDSAADSHSPLSSFVFTDPLSLGEGTNWTKTVSRTAIYQDYALTLSQSKGKTSYYASFDYRNQQGIIINSGMESISGRFNVSHQLFKWLKLTYNGSYKWRNNSNNKTQIGGSGTSSATHTAPTLSIGDNYNPYASSVGSLFNNAYVRATMNTDNTERNTTNHTFIAQINPLKGLTIKSTFSYYLYSNHRFQYQPGTLPAKSENEGGYAYRYEYNEHNLNSETTVGYEFDKNAHHFDAVAGFSAYGWKSNSFSLSGSGYTDDTVKWNNMAAISDKETLSPSTGYSSRQQMSVYARVNWNYKGRYYLTATGRYDGASNFAANHKWGFFPSGAFKWALSNEEFMRDVDWIDNLAVRLSVGRSGNNSISAYQSLSVLGTSTSGWIFDGSQPANMYRSRLDSPDLTWEKTTMYNAGVDWSFIEGKINITAEAYMSFTTDLLLSVQTASQTGYSTRLQNLGRVSNKGLELTIETQNITHPKFRWSTAFTISHNKQRVEDIGTENYVSVYDGPGNTNYMMYGYVKGYPLNALWGFKSAGVFKTQEEIDRNSVTKEYVTTSTSIELGSMKVLDIDHDGVLSSEDLIYLGNADPYIYGGLQNTFNIYGFNLGIYFAYNLGGKIYNINELYMQGSNRGNQYRYMLDAWHPERNPDSDIPRAGHRSNENLPASSMVHDASFLRLKTISISYTFNLRKSWIRDLTLSAVGDNIYLWKYYNGFDPDVSTSSDSALRRLDDGSYPKARTFTFSIQLRY